MPKHLSVIVEKNIILHQGYPVIRKNAIYAAEEPIENTLVISKQDLVTEEEPTEKQLMMTIIKQNGETCTTKWRTYAKKWRTC